MPTWNTANVVRAGYACLFGFALVVLSASLADADFGPRITIGSNYQQTSDVLTPSGFTEGNCTNVPFCGVLFQPIPQQLPLIVQHVSCIVTVTAGTVRFARLATRKGDTAPYTMTQLLPASNDGAAWVISSPVVHLLKSGERPHLIFSNSENANWQIECNVSGQLQQSWQQPPHTSALMGRRWG